MYKEETISNYLRLCRYLWSKKNELTVLGGTHGVFKQLHEGVWGKLTQESKSKSDFVLIWDGGNCFPLTGQINIISGLRQKGRGKQQENLPAGESSSQLPKIILGLQLLAPAMFKELAVLKVYSKNVTREFKYWPCKEKFHGEESNFQDTRDFVKSHLLISQVHHQNSYSKNATNVAFFLLTSLPTELPVSHVPIWIQFRTSHSKGNNF